MPRAVRRAPPPQDPAVRGTLPELGDTKDVNEVLAESNQVDMCYMCRAFSEENRPGYHANEDRFYCEEHVRKGEADQVDMFIVGVLDGHDGALAADMVADQLPAIVFQQCFLEKKKVHDAHEVAFAEVEKSLEKTDSTAGCCANSCVVWGRYLWCANLGDCRAVYIPLNHYESPEFETGQFCWLSRDLKASAPYEQQRIRDCGWRVTDGRVEGLEPTRTIGDFDVKAKVPAGVISIVPETRMVDMIAEARKIDPAATTMQGILVQGTDGIWDVVTGQDILNAMKARKKHIRNLQKYVATAGKNFNPEDAAAGSLERLAGDLVTFAVTKGSSDDCTAICTCVNLTVK